VTLGDGFGADLEEVAVLVGLVSVRVASDSFEQRAGRIGVDCREVIGLAGSVLLVPSSPGDGVGRGEIEEMGLPIGDRARVGVDLVDLEGRVVSSLGGCLPGCV